MNYGISAEQWAQMGAADRHQAISDSARRRDNGWWVKSTISDKGYGEVIEQVDEARVKVEWIGGDVECEWRDEVVAVADDRGDLEAL